MISDPVAPPKQNWRYYGAMVLLWLLVSAMLIKLSSAHITSLSGWDPDDQLRLVQLRDFLGGQSWFDTTQYRLNPPFGGPMHWSRLIELPLALIVILLAPIIGTAHAEMVAGTVVPLCCLGGIAYMLSGIAERIGGRAAGISAFLLTLISPGLLIQLRPMRIDHHGWQIFCAALALTTLFWSNVRKAGLVLGAALAAWIHISLEGAPMTAVFFLLLGWRWIMAQGEADRLFWTLAGFTGGSLLLFFGTQANGLSAAQYCDTISPTHIWAILSACAIMLSALRINPESRWARGAIAMVAGVAAIAVLLSLAPLCRAGAFGGMDPIIRDHWYVKVDEGLPIWSQDPANIFTLVTPLLVAILCWILAWRFSDKVHRHMLLVLGLFLFSSSLLTLFVFRTMSVATLFAIIPAALCLAASVRRYVSEPVLAKRLLLAFVPVIVMTSGLVAGSVATAFQPTASPSKQKQAASNDACESFASIRALSKLPTGNILASLNIGPAILVSSRHKVLASSHHRNVQGMRDQLDIERIPTEQSRALIAKHKIDYVIDCKILNYNKSSISPEEDIWTALSKDNAPDWLEYHGTYGKGLRVWRVR
jgi:hypothetical protein